MSWLVDGFVLTLGRLCEIPLDYRFDKGLEMPTQLFLKHSWEQK
jgi:hypothetical protein